MAAETNEGPKLSQIFDELWKSYLYIDTSDEPTVSPKVQNEIKTCIEKSELGIRMVNALALYSDNEELEEMATADIRYMLLPGLMGYFTLKNTLDERLEVIKRAQAYFIDYLKLVKLYGITDVKIPEIKHGNEEEEQSLSSAPARPGPPDLDAMARQRASKIEQYRKQKELEARLKELHEQVTAGVAEDSVQRSYYKTLLRKWVNKSLEELESIEAEFPILRHMAKMKAKAENQGTPAPVKPQDPPKPKFRPFILTRNQLQAQVIGAGYPSLPTYTLDQFYEMRYKDQCEQQTSVNGQSLQDLNLNPDAEKEQKEADEVEKEQKIEQDDEEALMKARSWDDWKDDHRRGWGNRQNMG